MILISSNLSSLILSENDSTLKDAISIIQNSKEKIALVIDNNNKLISAITDGDIRRSLLTGNDLNSKIKKSISKDFLSIDKSSNNILTKAKNIMRINGIRQLPVLNTFGEVVDLYFLDESITPLSNSVVLMAGGKGKRLRPHTANCPKPMLQVGNKPMLEIILENCISRGLSKFYISVNYLKDQIINYFQDGSQWGVSINYLIEEEPLGTAGCLALLPRTLTEPFLVINGDILTRLNPSNLISFHNSQKSMATLCVRKHTLDIPFGVVETDGFNLLSIEEKPNYNYLINAGVYIINPSIISIIEKHKFIDMPSLLKLTQNQGHKVSVCPIHEYWIDVGNPDSLKEAYLNWNVSDIN